MSNLLGKELRVKCYAVEKICRKGREVLNLLGKEPRVRCHVVEKIWREGYVVSCQTVVLIVS
jgi:hypothetical protein